MLNIGEKAPEFTLPDANGNEISLKSYRGKKVVVYFYPKDSTPGCTRQAESFRDAYEAFCTKGIEVIGISRDSQASHRKFAEKNQLPFVLLSDPERAAIEPFGVWQEKKLYGKVSMGIVRSAFLIDEEGNVEMALYKVKPDAGAQEILAHLTGKRE